MPHYLGTPTRSHLRWTSAHVAYGLEEAKKLHKRLLSGSTVDIYVGPDKKHWSLHRNLLCHHSSYFETEFQGHEVPKGKNGRPGEDQLELPDDDPRGFELLVKWLYQGQLEDCADSTAEKKYDYAVACHKLYMLCDKFDMIRLKNLAMDQYRLSLNEAELVPDADEINEIYRVSPPYSPFRRLMTKIAARQIMDPEVDKDAESYRGCFQDNTDFAVDMINSIRLMSGGMLFEDPTAGDECSYHDHIDGDGCYKDKSKAMVNGSGKGNTHHMLDSYRVRYSRREGSPTSLTADAKSAAELSAERRTPRKLNVASSAHGSKSGPAAAKHSIANGNISSPTKASNINGKVADASSQASSVASGPRKLPTTPNKGHTAKAGVLGKRRNPNDNGHVTSQQNSVANGPKKPGTVNGIVNHLNGNNDPSQVNQASIGDLAIRKGPPKLKRAVPNGV